MTAAAAAKASYIVVEKSWHYNDEYYSEEDGTRPQRAFHTWKEAEEWRERLEIDHLRGMTALGDYAGYDGMDRQIVKPYSLPVLAAFLAGEIEIGDDTDAKALAVIKGLGGNDNGDYDSRSWDIPEAFTDDQIRVVMRMIKMRFYDVVEVPHGSS